MNFEGIEQNEFVTTVANMAMERLVAKVNGVLPPAEPRRKSERSKVIVDSFSMPWDAFDAASKRELWEGYVKVLIVRTLLRIKELARARATRVKFFRFATPPSSHNQRVLVFDVDGVFATLTVKRCAHQTHKERVSPVVEFEFKVEVGEFDK